MHTYTTLLALLGQAIGDSFGAPFEYHEGAPQFALQSLREQRYLRCFEDCKLAPRRCRSVGLYTDDTQQALLLLWIWSRLEDKQCDPLDAALSRDMFLRACQQMASTNVNPNGHSFGVHRGTGKNFRDAIIHGTPTQSAGLGPAMRIGPVATKFESPKVLIPWVIEVSTSTTTDAIALAGAALFATRVWFLAHPSSKESLHLDDLMGVEHGLPAEFVEAWRMLREAYRILSMKGEDSLLTFAQPWSDKPLNCAANGFALTGVPWVLWVLDECKSFAEGLKLACASGGDTDTVCAMVGCGAALKFGEQDIPKFLQDSLLGAEHIRDPSLWFPVHTEKAFVNLDAQLISQVEREVHLQALRRKALKRRGKSNIPTPSSIE